MTAKAVYLNHMALCCALGNDHAGILQKLRSGDVSHLTRSEHYSPGLLLPLGMVELPQSEREKITPSYRTRCNQLMLSIMAQLEADFEQARSGVDPLRIAIILGTSTSSIEEGELAFAAREKQPDLISDFHYSKQEMAASADCLAQALAIKGPVYTISTACSSAGKALASARRLLQLELCDLVIAGGVDSLCRLTVNGFLSLDAVSSSQCQPFSNNRKGINLGEGGALFILSRKPGPVRLRGVGESSDAYHISSPQPQGAGAALAMELALADAGLQPADIDYINLHGTATGQNDSMESIAVSKLFGSKVACSSTKPYTGHVLGAAGALEAAFCWLTLLSPQQGLPVHVWDACKDALLPDLNFVSAGATGNGQENNEPAKYLLSNSFAFGGNNLSLLFEAVS